MRHAGRLVDEKGEEEVGEVGGAPMKLDDGEGARWV